ncbi:hypothetical protein JAAARDRAFT_30088 [Jaapia argillacea MUCL 33604]|uniref:Cwf19-like C-terminal domain-containing protein n=1 Tax=Jaapia argillacea MUCL 33604 TaxID=933084 RepID=A0A067Q557_9AGAM|nr:hypothetical protein JAAARDRAFT_30088 [Jaapia argillacea MUCL 33604]
MWVEKNIDMEESLKLTSRSTVGPSDPPLPPSHATETRLSRDEWMLMPAGVPTGSTVSSGPRLHMNDDSLTEDYGDAPQNERRLDGGIDFFSNMGTERKKKPPPDRVDPEKPKVSSREINPDLRGIKLPEQSTPKTTTPGGPGSQWRMMKLRRVYETAQDENKPLEEVAIERFGSLEAFEQAKEERRILDEREERKAERGRTGEWKGKGRDQDGGGGAKGFMFNDFGGSASSSRSSSFRRPGATPSTPSPATGAGPLGGGNRRRLVDQGGIGTPLAQSHTPIPSVMTPPVNLPASSNTSRALSPSSLNRLQAKVLRAKLMQSTDAADLEREYEEELKKSQGSSGEGGVRTKVEVLPSLDGRGRLYDVGSGKDDHAPPPGNRRKKEKIETRDPKTGDLVRINADDDTLTLGDMLRQERFGAGSSDQKDMDAQFARAIATDAGFVNDLDYIDDNSEKLARQKMRSDAMKRQFAINDYKRTQTALATCPFCFGEDDSPPKAPIVSMGTRVYLSRTVNNELVDGHCLIVPIQHHLAMLEGDDDVWDEVRNFMKCLMKMFAEEDEGVVFFETVLSFKKQNHTFIECIPVPWEQFEEVPAYFRESILTSETEWSQHRKLIDFSARPGGFRRAMVPNLPYFMVQFDYKGEKGYGHVIEGTGEVADEGDEEGGIDEGAKGGGEFPRYFAGEIIGNLLELEPRRWRHPKKVDLKRNKERVAEFKRKYDRFDWTGMIGRS